MTELEDLVKQAMKVSYGLDRGYENFPLLSCVLDTGIFTFVSNNDWQINLEDFAPMLQRILAEISGIPIGDLKSKLHEELIEDQLDNLKVTYAIRINLARLKSVMQHFK